MTRSNSRSIILGLIFTAALIFGLILSTPAYSQVVGGTLSGTITDASGGAIPNATVSIKNMATGVTTNVTTNAQGIYNAPNLLPGSYQATASAEGFDTKSVSDIVLAVGAQQVLNFAMKVGTISERVEISTLAPDLQLASSAIGNVVDSKTVVELPLNGRSWTDLAALQPGVSTIRAMVSVTSTDRLGRGLGVELSVSGGRPQQNNYLMNGVSINDYSNQAPGSILGGNLGVDAVAEFNVLTTNQSTEYGRTSGGVISAITRSGTNKFHGTAFEYLRNSALDARNTFDSAKPAFKRNQYGFSAGGPIRKDKTFIFGSYEGLRENLGLTEVDFVPSLNARNGIFCDFSNPDPTKQDCSLTKTVVVSPNVQPYLNFYPKPNGKLECTTPSGGQCFNATVGDIADFNFGGARITHENYFITRVDHRLSDRDNLSGSYMFDNAPSSQNDAFNNKIVFFKTRRQLVTIEENHVFSPMLVNSIRFGFNRVLAAAPAGGQAINPLAADTSLGFAPGQTAGSINVGGLTGFTGGLSTTQPQVFHWNSWQGYDNLFLVKGVHSLKFGANVERIQDNSFSSSFPGGVFNFGSLQDFITGQQNDPATPISLSIDVPGHVTPRGIRETLFGTYIQDDVRYRPNLTFNIGLRYEMATVPTDVHGQLATLHHLTDAAPVTGSPLFANPSLRDFEPRAGFSWDPFRDGKTAIRGGFGMFDVQVLPLSLRHTVDGTVPFALSGNGSSTVGDTTFFPKGAFNSFSADPTTERVAFIEQHPPRNYVMQWNLNVQREIAPGTTAMIAYVGTRSVHNLFQSDDASIVLPLTKTQFGFLWPIPPQRPASPLPVLNPNFGRVSVTLWNSSATYHALELQVKKRLTHGLQAQASYTFGKSIDSSSGTTDGDQFQNGISTLFFFDQKVRRGLSDFNVKHTLTVSYTWDVPSPKDWTGPLGWAASGWEFGGILQANTGVPFTPTIGPDPLGLNNTDPFDFPDYVPGCNPIQRGPNFQYFNLSCFTLPVQSAALAGQCVPFTNAPAAPVTCANLLGNAGRNSLVGPGLVNLDFSLYKNNPINRISETFNVQFRMEIFNSLNHANYNPPTSNTMLFDGTGAPVQGAGVITSTATTSRQIQFALKFIW
jgi:hypothetical protein